MAIFSTTGLLFTLGIIMGLVGMGESTLVKVGASKFHVSNGSVDSGDMVMYGELGANCTKADLVSLLTAEDVTEFEKLCKEMRGSFPSDADAYWYMINQTLDLTDPSTVQCPIFNSDCVMETRACVHTFHYICKEKGGQGTEPTPKPGEGSDTSSMVEETGTASKASSSLEFKLPALYFCTFVVITMTSGF